MDIIKFIEEGTTVPNPNYKKGAKKGLSSIPRLHSDNIEDVKDPTDATARVISEQTYGLTNLRDEANKFSKNKAYINPISSQEELEYERAKNQPLMTQFGHMLGQALGNEIILGTVRGFSDLFDAFVNAFSDENDYTNPVSRTIEDWQSYVRDELLPIYQKQNDEGFHINDFGWWMNGLTSAATTVSLMVPGMAVSKGAGLIGKIGNIGGKAGKLARKGVRVLSGGKNTGRIYHTLKGGAEIGTMAFISRTAENYQEAREVYKNVYDKSLSELASMSSEERNDLYSRNPEFQGLSDNEIAEQIASVSSGHTFANDYWMLLMDIPQFKALSSIWKGAGVASKATTRALRKANREQIAKLTGKTAAEVAAEETAKRTAKGSILERIGTGAKDIWTSTEGLMLGEGVEEGFQGIQTQKGEEIGNLYFNPELSKKQLGDYLTDESIWEQAFWGVMGGLLFQGAASGVRRIGDKARAKMNSDKLTDEQMKALAMGENKARGEEIYGRFKIMDDFNDKMDLINNGYNPFKAKLDERGQYALDETGKIQYEQIQNVDEAERLKSVALDDFLTEFTLNAVDNGNYELLKDFVSNPEFSKYFEEHGVQTDKLLESQVLAKMDEIKTQYENSYYDIIDNTDAYNDYITRLAARKLTRKKLEIESLDERIDGLDNEIANAGLSDTSHYENIAMQRMINEKIKANRQAIAKLESEYKKRGNFYSKQAYEREVKALREQQAYLLRRLNQANSLFDISGFENEDIAKMLEDAQAYYDNFVTENINKTTSFENLSDSVQRNLYAKANYQLYKEDLERELPQTDDTKDFYKELYDDTEATLVGIAESKFTDAFRTVQDFLKQQENPAEALDDILKNGSQNTKLNNALDILQFGAYNRQQYNNMLSLLLMSEVSKREREAADKTEVEGEQPSQPVADAVEEKIDDATSSPTGEQENNPTTPVEKTQPTTTEDDTSAIGVEEENDIISPDEAKALEEMAADFAQQSVFGANDFPIVSAENAAQDIKRTNNELFSKVVNEGINSQAYADFLQKVKDQMVVQYGVTPENADKYAESGIQMMLDLALNANKRSGIPFRNYDPIKIKNLFDSISKAIGVDPVTLNSLYVSADSQQSEDDKQKNVKEVFDNYVKAFNIGKSEFDGRIVINLRELFKELSNLCDQEGYTYNTLLAVYKDMATFVNSYKGNEYTFLNKDFLNKNFDDFLNNLNAAKTEKTIVSPFMHFGSTLQSKNNATVVNLTADDKIRLVNYARENGVEIKIVRNDYGPVSIGFGVTYKGKYYELGMLALITKDKNNRTLTRRNTYYDSYNNPYTVELSLTREQDGSISSNQDILFNSIVDNEELYDLIADWYIQQNPTQFYFEDGNTSFVQRHSKLASIESIKKFLNNDVIKSFAKANGIDISYDEDTTNSDLRKIFGDVSRRISNVVFYSINNKVVQKDGAIDIISSKFGLKRSYREYKNKMYDNFKQTSDIYDRLLEAEEENGKGASIKADLKSDDVGKIRYDSTNPQNAATLGIKGEIEKHPFVYSEGDVFIDENGKQYKGIPGLGAGSIGIVMGENQGDRTIDDGGNVSVLPGVNIALATEANIVSNTSTVITEATNNYITNSINDYFDVMSDRNNTKEEKDRAFEKLYNTLNNLFGNTSSKIFNGFFVVKDKTGDRFSICTGNAKTWNPVISFVKYSRLHKDNGVYKTNEGRIVSGEDLMGFYTGTAFIPVKDKTKKVVNLKNANSRKLISSTINAITSTMTFNTTRFAIDKYRNKNVSSEHIKVDDEGKMYITVGTYESPHYNSFTEMVVDLNMYKFSQVGSRYDNRYEYDRLPRSFFLDISKEQAPATEEQLKQETVLTYWIEENNIQPNDEVSTNDVLEHLNPAQVPKEVVDSLKNLNAALGAEGTPLFTEKVRINANIKAFARYTRGEILIGKSGVNLANTRANEMIRMLIHENIHRIVKEQKFFNGKQGKRRLEELQEIFDEFYNALSNESRPELQGLKEHLLNTFNDLLSRYPNNQRVLMDEFMAEVISDGALRNYLNNVESKEKVSVNNVTEKKTLLQKILEKIAELFNLSRSIKDDTLLAKFYNAIGNVSLENSTEPTLFDVVEDSKGAIDISPVEEAQQKDNPSEPGSEPVEQTEEQAAKPQENLDLDTKVDYDDFDKFLEGLDSKYESYEDVALVNFDNSGRENNPTQIINVPDMDTFVNTFPTTERAAVASELTTGRLQYACR